MDNNFDVGDILDKVEKESHRGVNTYDADQQELVKSLMVQSNQPLIVEPPDETNFSILNKVKYGKLKSEFALEATKIALRAKTQDLKNRAVVAGKVSVARWNAKLVEYVVNLESEMRDKLRKIEGKNASQKFEILEKLTYELHANVERVKSQDIPDSLKFNLINMAVRSYKEAVDRIENDTLSKSHNF